MFLRKCRVSIPSETWWYIGIVIVVIVGAVIREINLLLILSGLMLVPILLSRLMVGSMLHRLRCERRHSKSFRPNELISVELALVNPRRRLDSWALVVQDQIQKIERNRDGSKLLSQEAAPRVFIPFSRHGSTQTAKYEGALQQRGRYQLGPLQISTRAPLGLFRGTMTVNTLSELLVTPRIGIVSTQWKEFVKAERIGQRSNRKNHGQLEGDFFGLRDWRNGDSRRWIHWRSSAKRNELVVRQFEQSRNQDFVIILDLSVTPEQFSTEQGRAAVELAVSFVATVISDHCRRGGGQLTLAVAGGTDQSVRGTASNALLQEAMEILADAHATTGEHLATAIDRHLGRFSSDDRVIIVGTRPIQLRDSARLSEAWADVQKRRALSSAICVDVTSDQFAAWFSFDEETRWTRSAPSEPPANAVSAVGTQSVRSEGSL
ncbi:MAG: DUF58 domain-containing protein [Planctomycetales bacterium]|nr:DUF58 domain-containing protein [Planctomycetales bacterium]